MIFSQRKDLCTLAAFFKYFLREIYIFLNIWKVETFENFSKQRRNKFLPTAVFTEAECIVSHSALLGMWTALAFVSMDGKKKHGRLSKGRKNLFFSPARCEMSESLIDEKKVIYLTC